MISESGKLSVKIGHLSTESCQQLLQINSLILDFVFILLSVAYNPLVNRFSRLPLLENLGEEKFIVP